VFECFLLYMKPEPNVYVVYPKVMIKYFKQRLH